MATRRLLIILLIGYIMTSCTKEVVTIIDVPKEQEKPGKISLQIKLGSNVNTKSGWEYDEYFPPVTPQGKEDEVNNVLLVVFKNIFLEEYVMYEDKGVLGDFSFDTVEGVYKLHKAGINDDEIDLDPGIHYFYAILNIPDGLFRQIEPILENGKYSLTKETFEKQVMEVSLEYLNGSLPTSNGFIMTNTNPPDYNVIYTEEQGEKLGRSNEVTITAGRALAKVSLAYVPAKTGELHGSLTNIQYKTVNHPSAMYLMPVKEDEILKTPHYSNSASTNFLWPIREAGDDAREWLTATTRDLMTQPTFEFDFDYCIENNVKNHLKSNSTGLLIRAKFNPEVWLNKDGTVGKETENRDGTFWRIRQFDNDGYLLTYTQGYYNQEPDSICRTMGNYFETVKYPGGICYYTFWLRTGSEHLVKRNDFHRVVITHIHGAGSPDIDEIIDPDVDPDPIPTIGAIYVYAMNWDDYTQIETIGQQPWKDEEAEVGTGMKEWEENEQKKELQSGDDNIFN